MNSKNIREKIKKKYWPKVYIDKYVRNERIQHVYMARKNTTYV